MVLFQGRKLQRLAEVLQRIQAEIEREGGETDARAEEGLAEAARRAGVNLEVVRLADLPTLEAVLGPGGRPDPGRCWAVAELLFLDALRIRAAGGDADATLEKARALFRDANRGRGLDLPDGVPPPAERLRRIEDLLEVE